MSAAGIPRTTLEVRKIALIARTPLQVGSGISLRKGVDFVVEGADGAAQVLVVDVDRALDLISDEQLAAVRQGRIVAALDSQALRQCTRGLMRVPGGRPVGEEIREQIRLVDGTPYVPGSSLKGALRTAVLVSLVGAYQRSPAALGDSTAVEDLLCVSGQDPGQSGAGRPNRDLMRMIRVSDLVPTDPPRLELVEAAVTPIRDRSAGRASEIPIWCEAFAPGAVLEGTITVEKGGRLSEARNEDQIEALHDLRKTIRSFSLGLARYEEQAYRSAGGSLPELFRELLDNEGRVKVTAVGADGLWPALPLGWGTGWHAKTVASVLHDRDPATWAAAAGRAKRPRRSVAPQELFPTTRRMARTTHGTEPMGWVAVVLGRPSTLGAPSL
jgi:CRISPR-associated protein Csm5